MLQLILMSVLGTAFIGWAISEVFFDEEGGDSEAEDDTIVVEPDDPVSPEPEPEPEPETIVGTDGNDTLELTERQTAFGYAGDDTISADYPGNVTIHGGDGNDSISSRWDSEIFGEDGDDTIDAWFHSTVEGGAGNDSIYGGRWADISGGEGNDSIEITIEGRADGGAGNDTIVGRGDSTVIGGSGNDLLSGGSTNAVAVGGTGNDTISVNGGTRIPFSSEHDFSRAYGGDGDDVIFGRDGSVLYGGEGNDTLTASVYVGRSPYYSELNGGEGSDEFNIAIQGVKDNQSPAHSPRTAAYLHDFDPNEDVLTIFTGISTALRGETFLDYQIQSDRGSTSIILTIGDSESNPQQHVIELPNVDNLSEDQIHLVDSSGPELSLVRGTEEGDSASGDASSYYTMFGGDDTVDAGGDHNVALLGDGNDVLNATSSSLHVRGGAGNDSITWDAESSSDIASRVDLGSGDDFLSLSGDNVYISTGHGGADVIEVERDAGESVEIWFRSYGGNQATIGMGHKVTSIDEGDAVTVNVYPEHLDREPATLSLGSANLEDMDIVLNLPPEVTGDIEVTRSIEYSRDRYEDVWIATISTADGTSLFTLDYYGLPSAAEILNLITINRDVTYA